MSDICAVCGLPKIFAFAKKLQGKNNKYAFSLKKKDLENL